MTMYAQMPLWALSAQLKRNLLNFLRQSFAPSFIISSQLSFFFWNQLICDWTWPNAIYFLYRSTREMWRNDFEHQLKWLVFFSICAFSYCEFHRVDKRKLIKWINEMQRHKSQFAHIFAMDFNLFIARVKWIVTKHPPTCCCSRFLTNSALHWNRFYCFRWRKCSR